MQSIETPKQQKSASQKYWERKGVKFVKSKCIPMSLSGAIGEERDSWTAYYKKKHFASGGYTIESLLEWMDSKKENRLKIMKMIDAETKQKIVID